MVPFTPGVAAELVAVMVYVKTPATVKSARLAKVALVPPLVIAAAPLDGEPLTEADAKAPLALLKLGAVKGRAPKVGAVMVTNPVSPWVMLVGAAVSEPVTLGAATTVTEACSENEAMVAASLEAVMVYVTVPSAADIADFASVALPEKMLSGVP